MADNEPITGTGRITYQERGDEAQVFYANVINVNHTPWDFALHFYSLVLPVMMEPTNEPVDLQPRKLAVVSVPVTLMRGLIEALQKNLQHYEDKYGRVDIPKAGGPEKQS